MEQNSPSLAKLSLVPVKPSRVSLCLFCQHMQAFPFLNKLDTGVIEQLINRGCRNTHDSEIINLIHCTYLCKTLNSFFLMQKFPFLIIKGKMRFAPMSFLTINIELTCVLHFLITCTLF